MMAHLIFAQSGPIFYTSPTNEPKSSVDPDAARTWGFFQVTNHVHQIIPRAAEKRRNRNSTRGELGGVMYAKEQRLVPGGGGHRHDSLQCGWPGGRAGGGDTGDLRKEVVEWDAHVKNVADKVMELLGLGLGLDAGKFKELTFSDGRAMVGHIYPYCPQPDLTLGITPHTDPGIITVLLQNEIQGLQVKHGDDWVDVKPIPGGLIINIGDFLQIVSNGEYKSVQHRVLANASREPRISIVTFINLVKWRDSDSYGPLPELLTPEKPAIYRDFTRQEFLKTFTAKDWIANLLWRKSNCDVLVCSNDECAKPDNGEC
ncbi:hypothetical protein DH2020_026429 [Rehmannia glutinosa]|uniref:Fe2OG dioxygenase domain-containing protein n=1 Tax=Rehmannia glutinosa TaxID=99300 RepID=A0ABR0VYT7_REHGL